MLGSGVTYVGEGELVGSQFTQYKSPAYVNLDFEPTFTAKLLRKDFDLGLAAALTSAHSGSDRARLRRH